MFYTDNAELLWLQELITWSHSREKYISSLQNNDSTDNNKDVLQEWLNQFSQLRIEAENLLELSYQRGFSPNNQSEFHHLSQKSQELNRGFSNFLQDQLVGGEKEKGYSVPIGGHSLPPLPYDYDALEPHISEKIMRLHHDEHHKGYVEGLNKAEEEMQKARQTGDYSLIRHWERMASFNGAGHYLHTIFWYNMSPNGGGKPTGAIAEEINRTFGSFEKFKKHFSNAAEKVQSVGWALLVWSPRAWRTEILQAEEHQNLSQQDMIPLLALDVWEHAYYLQYTNNRSDYIDSWWNIVNWDYVNRRFEEARKVKWEPF